MVDLKNMPKEEIARRRARAYEGRDELYRVAAASKTAAIAIDAKQQRYQEDIVLNRKSRKANARFLDALFIQQGACNPSGIARSLAQACKDCLEQGVDQRTDPAVRLIVHQLAYLCGVAEIDSNTAETICVYGDLLKACEAQAAKSESAR